MRQIGDERGVVVVLVNLVDVALSAGEYEAAADLGDRAAAAARDYGDPEIECAAYVNGATANLHLDRAAEARRLALEGLQLAKGRGEVDIVANALRVIAILVARAGHLRVAARLDGAVQRILDELELGLEPAEQVLHDELASQLSALDSAARAEESARGRALTIDDAVAVATRAPDVIVDAT
jgi:hypothetical protein